MKSNVIAANSASRRSFIGGSDTRVIRSTVAPPAMPHL